MRAQATTRERAIERAVPQGPLQRRANALLLACFGLANPSALVGPALAAIAALGVLGVHHLRVEPDYGLFDLDSEGTIPAAFSAFLLAGAAATALAAAIMRPDSRSSQPWLAVGLLFAFMAADEWEAFHERLESGTGIDWQVLYLPLFAAAAAACLPVLRRLRPFRHAVPLFVGGAVAWLVAQGLELAEWGDQDRQVAAYEPMMVAEELLEMAGSLTFWLALAHVLRRGALELGGPAGER